MAATKKMMVNIKSRLSLATCTLLSISPGVQAQVQQDDLVINNSVLVYSESDRVTTVAPQVNIRKTINEYNSINASVIYDTVTGSSPTGEVPYGNIQTVTSPSGNISTVSADTRPSLSFEDSRVALAANWKHIFSRRLTLTGGINASSEEDYESSGGSISFNLDSEDKLTTWSLSLASSKDDISRSSRVDDVSGIPKGLTNSELLLRQSDQEIRHSNDTVVGLTQVLSPTTLMQISLTQSHSDGYHSDPYKLISIVDGNGVQVVSYYEKRPDLRSRDILYTQIIHNIEDDVLRLGFRYYRDDWDITSYTFDLKYRASLNGYYMEPHFRYYQQSAAGFHRYYLNSSDIAPQYASADSRLAEFNSYTVGLSSGFREKNYQFSARIEYMSQQADPDRSNDPANLQAFNLFNGVEAIITQVNLTLYY